jgi:rare lipoprotein A
MKASVLLISILAFVACRVPQARTNSTGPVQAKTDDPVLQDGAPVEERAPVTMSEGFASWYGKELQGRPTASGEMFDMNKMTAAHRDFPMNSLVLVKNVETGKKAMVKINDRGPYVDGRIIDVSYVAARELGFAEKGVTKVQLELIQAGEDNFMAKAAGAKAIGKPKGGAEEEIIEPLEEIADDEDDDGKIHGQKPGKQGLVFLDGKKPRGYTVQVGAFHKKVNAERHRDEILESYPQKAFIATNGKWHFVCIGDFKSKKQAKEFIKKLSDDGIEVMYRGKVS